ncbi:MAG: cation-translocating P-type ATPase [Acidobacteria bacterium]|nr:cation-translocating P-type ATPase [Acidobacteriota bacterium]
MMQVATKRNGLTVDEARARLQQYGPNSLPEKPPTPLWQRFLSQFRSPLIYILLFALAVDIIIWFSEGATGLPVESIAIAIILLLNAGLGVYQESKSEAALAKLKEMTIPLVWVMRDGKLEHLPGAELVPGDVVRIEAGDRIPADGNLIEAEGAMVDESLLTGESVPVEKEIGNEAFSGTLLVRGKSYLEVSRTGEMSAMGRLAVMIGGIEAEPTPLERRLEKFGRQIARAVLALTVLIAVGGLLVEGLERISHVFLFAVALAVAAVPEGLPAVLTLTLALGVERMAKRKAVVRRLSAVEALGSVTVIATDKTGTLTENRMLVKDLDSLNAECALRAMVLANDAEETAGAGDPLELALLEYAHKQGVEPDGLRREHPRYSSRPFDSSYKFMRVTVTEGGSPVSYLKGAPEVILECSRLSADERRLWDEKADAYAREGYRVLALGWREGEGDDEIEYLGLVLLWDPPRPEVPNAIRRAQDAGIRVLMVTGDHPATALAVAHEVGIAPGRVLTGPEMEAMLPEALREAARETNIFARVAPEHKLRLVEALKQSGEIVAMTGDGVNDAPALKRSDVGVAMGERGSDVSREVADLVLMDDNFATIVSAIEEGRNIYENIQKFIRFLFSTNLAEILIVVGGAFGAVLMGLRDETGAILLPLTAVQLLWVNIITDGPPALALGLDQDPGVMQERPRDPQSPLLDRESLLFILTTGCIKGAIGGALLVAMPLISFTLLETRTAIFLHATIGQLFYAYPARRINAPPRFNGALHLAVILGVGLQLLTVLLPGLRRLLGLEPLTLEMLTMVSAAVLMTWGVAEAYSRIALAAHHAGVRSA